MRIAQVGGAWIGGQRVAVIAYRGCELDIRWRTIQHQRTGNRHRGTAVEIGQSEAV